MNVVTHIALEGNGRETVVTMFPYYFLQTLGVNWLEVVFRLIF